MTLYLPPKLQYELGDAVAKHVKQSLIDLVDQIPAILRTLPGSPTSQNPEAAGQEILALLSLAACNKIQDYFEGNQEIADKVSIIFLKNVRLINPESEADYAKYFLDRIGEYSATFAQSNLDPEASRISFANAVAAHLALSLNPKAQADWVEYICGIYATYLNSISEWIAASVTRVLHG